MDSRFDEGMRVRTEVLGAEHVARAQAAQTPFDADFQRFITEYAWGALWARPHLDRRTRNLVTIAILAALGREELALHFRASRNLGVDGDDRHGPQTPHHLSPLPVRGLPGDGTAGAAGPVAAGAADALRSDRPRPGRERAHPGGQRPDAQRRHGGEAIGERIRRPAAPGSSSFCDGARGWGGALSETPTVDPGRRSKAAGRLPAAPPPAALLLMACLVMTGCTAPRREAVGLPVRVGLILPLRSGVAASARAAAEGAQLAVDEASHEYVFRTAIAARTQGAAVAAFVADRPRVPRVAVVHDSNEYGTAVAMAFEEALVARGVTVTSRRLYRDGETDSRRC